MRTIRDLKPAHTLLKAIEQGVIDTCDRRDMVDAAALLAEFNGVEHIASYLQDFAHGIVQDTHPAAEYAATLQQMINE